MLVRSKSDPATQGSVWGSALALGTAALVASVVYVASRYFGSAAASPGSAPTLPVASFSASPPSASPGPAAASLVSPPSAAASSGSAPTLPVASFSASPPSASPSPAAASLVSPPSAAASPASTPIPSNITSPDLIQWINLHPTPEERIARITCAAIIEESRRLGETLIDLSGKPITSLRGVILPEGLQGLYLDNTQIQSLGNKLPKSLKYLSLCNTPLQTLDNLSIDPSYEALSKLDLDGSFIREIPIRFAHLPESLTISAKGCPHLTTITEENFRKLVASARETNPWQGPKLVISP